MRAAFLLLFPAAAFAAELATPTSDPTNRYAGMMEQSPFALATVVEAPKEPTESFAANWELTGLAKLRNEKGVEKDFVTIRSRDRRVSFTLTGDEESTEEDAKGVSISSVDWQDGSRKSTVTLKKGTEMAQVTFGQDTAPQAPPNNGMPANLNQARGAQPQPLGINQGNPGAIRPPVGAQRPNMPNMPKPNLVVPGQPPATYPQPSVINGNVPNTNGNPVPRPRMRVINSKP